MNGFYWALVGTGLTFLSTALGAAVVFFFRKEIRVIWQQVFLGFAAGVMIAASVWSLIVPAIELSENAGEISAIPVAGGFILGIVFLMVLDFLLPHLHPGSSKAEGKKTNLQRTTLLIFAVTLHNIPEGMAVGLSFALYIKLNDPALLAAALSLSIGVSIQNFPEGAAISIPLRREGKSLFKSFLYGSLSGIVEPLFAVITIFVASLILPFMPWLLSFAAGAMMYVAIEELIPEAQLSKHSNLGTLGVMFGFVLMMILDISL